MNETNKIIIDLIRKNHSIKEISKILGISEKQLFVRIKQIINYGYNLNTSYCYNSDIYYNLKNDNHEINKNAASIKLSKSNNLFRCLVISDLHIGSVDADVKLINIVYDYAVKNGINIIFNCGDIIEGDYTSAEKNIKDLHEQIKYFVKKYPYDRNIINFAIFGNHDYRSLLDYGFDFLNFVKSNRYDIIPVGYGQGSVNIKDDSIILFHKLRDKYKPIINNEKILLSGHGHLMRTKFNDILWLGIPTLSYKSNDKNQHIVPGFVDLSIELENRKFEDIVVKHMIINPDIIQVSEVRGKVKNLFLNN